MPLVDERKGKKEGRYVSLAILVVQIISRENLSDLTTT